MGMRKCPWGRILTGAVAAVLFCVAIPLFFTSAEIRRRADEAQTAELLRLRVDLSHPGEFEGKLECTFQHAWGLRFQIVTEPSIAATTEPSAASAEAAQSHLAGLDGHLTIAGPDGAVVFEKPLRAGDFACRRIEHDRWGIATGVEYCALRGTWMSPGASGGTNVLKLAVDRGAVRLAGMPQVLMAQYELDGLEYVFARALWLFGFVGCAIGGLLVLAIIGVTIAKRADFNSRMTFSSITMSARNPSSNSTSRYRIGTGTSVCVRKPRERSSFAITIRYTDSSSPGPNAR
jgi:hypothetical protein